MSDSVKQEFETKISRLTKSDAYLDVCKEVSGYRMYLFNMMDKEQLDYVFSSITLSPQDTVLDLGCGFGSILKTLVKQSGCRGIGVDQLSHDIVEMDTAKYLNGDIDDFESFHLCPTVTLSVDSIYFSRDPQALLRALCQIPNNRVYLFYSQYLFEEQTSDKRLLQADRTRVGEILNRLNISYETIEYSNNERMLYENSLHALNKRKEIFVREGNLDLYEEKLKEQQLGKQLYDAGNASRYLYIIG